MPRTKKVSPVSKRANLAASTVSVKRTTGSANLSLLQKIQNDWNFNVSYLNIVLGLFIVVVAAILAVSYFRSSPDLGPAQQTAEEDTADVAPGDLPGKYTVKDGDTLFTIAEKYYQDGYQFAQIALVNNISNVDQIEAGQILELPAVTKVVTAQNEAATGGAVNQTTWGEAITANTYTVIEGDWLSTIAGRAYGDVMAFDKIAKANNISDANLILPGTVLQIPR